ncbi:hypothetical protein [Streptomyces sp. SHP 1-2]|uniref:hypothetical protein n=1 Tax=Streptomyces sp. SHP 1-2 TaxID=2769489 RepID=UPI002238888E|nr:hypothetical protein [Streptomyces sp. SHP 1-2]MCW5254703.1 hypothetical protein [Streptomyces sp. SHP 1-2]
MMWEKCHDLTAGPHRIPAARWIAGCLYDRRPRCGAPGWGAAVELPVVLELLGLVARGAITAEQAGKAFGPVLADLAVYDRRADALLAEAAAGD